VWLFHEKRLRFLANFWRTLDSSRAWIDDEDSQVLVVLAEQELNEVNICKAAHKGEEGGGSDFGVVCGVVQEGGFVQAGTSKATR